MKEIRQFCSWKYCNIMQIKLKTKHKVNNEVPRYHRTPGYHRQKHFICEMARFWFRVGDIDLSINIAFKKHLLVHWHYSLYWIIIHSRGSNQITLAGNNGCRDFSKEYHYSTPKTWKIFFRTSSQYRFYYQKGTVTCNVYS
jgi:hypothetical protein